VEELNLSGAKISDLCLDFTYPGRADLPLVPNGADVDVTISNLVRAPLT
jgi:hypothetical protein